MNRNTNIVIIAITIGLFASNLFGAENSESWNAARFLEHPTTEWLTNGGNLYNQRYSPLTQINTDNVKQLKAVWRVHLNGSGVGPPFSGTAQPIVHKGVMYMVTGADDVFAIDIASGELKWEYKSGLDPSISTICCGWTSRGVALGEDKIFVGRLDSQLVALDITTGKELWSVQAENWQAGYTITSAPLYFDGMVITGFAGAEYGVRGRIKAFSATDGSPLWTFYTVPGPGQFGHDTWPVDSDIWKRGGATIWQTPAVDPDLGLLYFSTGNAGPDFNGAVRKGDNLFSVSIVALDVKTGEYAWHFQQVHHDLWDYDSSNPVILFDVDIDGEPRKAIAQAGKTGWVYILDRVTGAPLLGIEERAVPQEPRQHTAATQPYPVGDSFVPQKMDMPHNGYPFVNEGRIFTPYWKDYVAIRPSSFGGAVWAPSSYDPRTHAMYICGIDLVGLFTGGTVDGTKPQEQFIGGEFAFAGRRTGIFAAMDLSTNKLLWQQAWDDSCYSGSTATAGNLVFTGQNDGRFQALDSSDGSTLWEFQTGAGVNAPPAVFEFNGQQHIAVYSAGALFMQSEPGDSVWLFSLNGTIDEVELEADSWAPILTMADAESATQAAGAPLFGKYCGQCHGAQGQGGHGGGPALSSGTLDPGHVRATIAKGSNKMPGFGAQLTYDELESIAAFIDAGMPNQ